MRLVLLLALAGCPSKPPQDPAFTPAGPKPCEKMADHVVDLMQPKDAAGKPVGRDQDTADKIARVLIDLCTKDGWSQDAQRCWTAAASFDDIEKCAPLMTVPQRDAMTQAIDAAFPRKPDAGSGIAPQEPDPKRE